MSAPFSPTGVSTLVELLEARAALQRDEGLYTFLDEGNAPPSHFTYGELENRAQAIAAQLQQDVAPGDRVLVLLPPGLELIAAFFGCLYAGAASVPLPPPHPARLDIQKERLLAIVADAQPSTIISSREIQNSLAPIAGELAAALGEQPNWLAIEETAESNSGNTNDVLRRALSGDTIAFLQYTSGSTSHPKGVLVSHENLLHNSDLICRAFDHSAHSQGVIWLPPYHDMGLIGGVLQPLFAGFPVTLMAPTSFLIRPLRWLQTVSEYRGTTSGGPNFAYDLCAKKITPEQKATLDLSSWSVAFAGAEPVRAETLENFAAAFAECGFRREAFLPCYGLAESTLFVTGFKSQPTFQTAPGDHRVLVGAGHAPDDMDVRIVDGDRSTLISENNVGEVWVSGKSVAKGYWNREAETRETFGARLEGEEKQFLRTGDLGFFRDGELFLTGRCKDLIIVGGRNHFAEDIERTVHESHERAGDVAAFSVETENGEQLAIAVEIEKLARVDDEEQRKIIAAARQAVASRHDLRAHEVQLVRAGALPRTPSGKIQRHRCRQFLKSH